MSRIKVMVNGIPGNMAVIVARHVSADERFTLVPWSLTGPEIEATEHIVEAIPIRLLKTAEREQVIDNLMLEEGTFLSVDYTHPSAVNANAEFYCKHRLPFVMDHRRRSPAPRSVGKVIVHFGGDCAQYGQTNCRISGND